MRILFVVDKLDANALGRTYSNWLIAQHLNWQVKVVSFQPGGVWAPLAGSPFAKVCSVEVFDDILASLRSGMYDLILATKPLSGSFGVADHLNAESGVPLVVDIDDPDLPRFTLRWPLRSLGREILRPSFMHEVRGLRRRLARFPRLVGNPTLGAQYGGALIPHVRVDPGFGAPHTSDAPLVAFVGTNRPHKGVDVLRDAVSRLQSDGFRLVVTDKPPADARPWERWVGAVPFSAGLDLVAGADIVVVPSIWRPYAVGQFPVKLVDGMLAGRAVVASSIDPMGWVLGANGLLAKPGSASDLAVQLATLRDPAVRSIQGRALRADALSRFTPQACSNVFRDACLDAVRA